MATIIGAILLLCVFLLGVACLTYSTETDKRIDEILAEEKRQNKRTDLLEKREQIRQSEERQDKTYIQSKDLFEKW